MIFSNKESVEDSIVRTLSLNGPLTAKKIQSEIKKDGHDVSIQSIYKTLNILLEGEVLLRVEKKFVLNEEWKELVIGKLENKSEHFNLNEGEKITYKLNSLIHLDQYWKNLVIFLDDKFEGHPVFLYNPHEIWIHLDSKRKESEYQYYGSFEKYKRQAFCVFGGDTLHDEYMKKELQNNYLQIVLKKDLFPKTDYIIIVGDYIITTRVSKTLASRIEDCYLDSNSIVVLEKRLSNLSLDRQIIKLVVERSRRKAVNLRRKISKDFYVSNEIINKYKLF